MEIAAARVDFVDVLVKVLLSIPQGFVFDEVYIIEKLSGQYFDKYMNFCALYGDSEEPVETAADAIRSAVEQFEGILVEEQNLKVFLPAHHSSLTSHKMWKRI